jgi:peptide/nickel transport system permease protein
MRNFDRRTSIGMAILLFFLAVALVGPLFVGSPTALVAQPLLPPSAEHWFGTNGQGQDVLAQTVVGTRSTLLVGLGVGAMVTLIGAVVGATSAFLGGVVDSVTSLLINIFLVMPGLPLVVVIAAYLPPGPATMAAVLIFTGWPWHARVVRAQVLTLRQRDYILAARGIGESWWRIVVVELLPNLASLLGSAMLGASMYAIGAQVGLEFLGLGDLARTTWGTNLYWANNDSALLVGAWWTFVPTGLCIALVGVGLSMLGFALDVRSNPRLGLAADAAPRPTEVFGRVPVAERPPAVFQVEKLQVAYGDQVVVPDFGMALRPGKTMGVVGESGSGKSTALLGALRLLPAPARVGGGAVRLGALELLGSATPTLRAAWGQKVALVPQGALSALNPVLRIRDHFRETFEAHGVQPQGGIEARGKQLLQKLGLKPSVWDAWPHTLSGGMRQRVLVALALALEAPVVVMDEPTTALDVVVERQLLRELIQLQAELGFSVVFITHDLALLLEFADEVCVLYAGRLVERAPAAVLAAGGARHPYTRGLIAALPPEPGEDRKATAIPGSPAQASAPPPGCAFHPRCSLAAEQCHRERPELRGATHAVACHLVQP